MNHSLKVGVIGTGFIGPAHIEAARRTFLAEVISLADVNDEIARNKALQYGVKNHFGNYRDLLKDDKIQIVHICTPNHLHFQMSKEALEAGKHVICEKPLAMNRQEAEELVELADKKGLVNAIHFNLRYYPLARESQRMVERGELGTVFAVHGSYLQDWLFYPTDYNWRLEPDMSGESRAIADIGSHWMDMIEFIAGEEIIEVFADFATFHPIRKKPLKPVETYAGKILQPEDYQDISIKTEDYATVLLHFGKGGHGVLTVNQVAAGRKNRLYFEIDGSQKAIAWDSEKPNELWIGYRDQANQTLLKDPSLLDSETRKIVSFPGGHNEGFPDTSKQLFKEVYQAVLDPSAPKNYPGFKAGLREVLLCEAILKSSKTNQWVEVK